MAGENRGDLSLLTWLLVTFGVALGSAVFPLVSIEVFIVALAAHHSVSVVWFGLVIAIGQVLGKLLYFYAARGSLKLPDFVHRKANLDGTRAARAEPTDPERRRSPWRRFTRHLGAGWAWLREKCHRHPKVMIAATATSSLIGVPPFLPTTVLAGLAGMRLRAYVAATLPTRWARFSLLAASPNLVRHWLHWLPLVHHHLH